MGRGWRKRMLIQADARNIPLADGSVQCCVTSPPYWGLRDYGLADGIGLERTPEEYVANIVQVFREVWRVLRDDGTLWLNLGDCYARTGGWASNDGLDGCKRGESGRAKTNMQAGRNGQKRPDNLKEKDLVGIPWRVAFALQADGWYLRSDIIWAKPNPMPESVTDRPTKSHEYLFLLAKNARYYYDAEAVREPALNTPGGRLTGSKHKSFANGSAQSGTTVDKPGTVDGRNRRDVWFIATQPYKGAHFATYPEKLVEPCILAGSKAGDVVLDPFCGSGTTGAVAQRLGRRFVGLDMSAEYLELARKRIGAVPIGMGI
jgi:DNA modification methylase